MLQNKRHKHKRKKKKTKTKQKSTRKKWWVHPNHTWIWINYPHASHAPIICNNNTMDMEFLVQMRQSNKCGSVRNNEIFNLHLGSGAGSWLSIPCLLQDTSHIYWFYPPKQPAKRKQRIQKWNSTPNKLYHTAFA